MLALLPAAHTAPTLTFILVSVGMLALAVADIIRREVEDFATIALLIVTVGGLAVEGISAEQWASGILSAAVGFTVYLALGTRGVLGGGDVKLSLVPALLLGACNPFLGVWWVAASLLIQHVFFLTARFATSGESSVVGLPHVPAMTTALMVAWVLFPM